MFKNRYVKMGDKTELSDIVDSVDSLKAEYDSIQMHSGVSHKKDGNGKYILDYGERIAKVAGFVCKLNEFLCGLGYEKKLDGYYVGMNDISRLRYEFKKEMKKDNHRENIELLVEYPFGCGSDRDILTLKATRHKIEKEYKVGFFSNRYVDKTTADEPDFFEILKEDIDSKEKGKSTI